ncbi:aldehyde reductase ii [Trichoderma arundinaceum]|uniref:Aldehyde reductase ii n=1 Tax=Trichoderma arundinaceum TaxID=490622 RepID=A0A395NAY3_TRIAR|nr:aldehyde reductase ii [Trichoderma arundinaceum]
MEQASGSANQNEQMATLSPPTFSSDGTTFDMQMLLSSKQSQSYMPLPTNDLQCMGPTWSDQGDGAQEFIQWLYNIPQSQPYDGRSSVSSSSQGTSLTSIPSLNELRAMDNLHSSGGGGGGGADMNPPFRFPRNTDFDMKFKSESFKELLENIFATQSDILGIASATAEYLSWARPFPFKVEIAYGRTNLGANGAYIGAIKGVAAILHVTYVTKIVPDLNEVITPTKTGIRSIMDAAMREASVKRVVFTSSALAASALIQGIDNGTVGRNSWNDAVLEAAWALSPCGMSHAVANYPASKVAAEKEVWRFVEENELPFAVNVVSPAGMTGEPLNKTHVEGQANWVVHAFRGNRKLMDPMLAREIQAPF